MPWLTIFTWIFTFLAAGGAESGEAGKAALIATGAAGAVYYGVEPTNPDRLWDVFSTDGDNQATMDQPQQAVRDSRPGIGSTVVQGVGAVVEGLGPTGTIATIAGVTGVFGDEVIDGIPNWLLILGGLGLLIVVFK